MTREEFKARCDEVSVSAVQEAAQGWRVFFVDAEEYLVPRGPKLDEFHRRNAFSSWRFSEMFYLRLAGLGGGPGDFLLLYSRMVESPEDPATVRSIALHAGRGRDSPQRHFLLGFGLRGYQPTDPGLPGLRRLTEEEVSKLHAEAIFRSLEASAKALISKEVP